MGETCQDCGRQYTLNLTIPDIWWEQICPGEYEPGGGGMLCAQCSMRRLELLDNGVGWIMQPAATGADLVCLNILLDAMKLMQDRLIRFRDNEKRLRSNGNSS